MMTKKLQKKLRTLEDITRIVSTHKQQGDIIVSLNGSFDILHAGHTYLIEEAKSQGDILIIGLNSDASYMNYKDRRGPILDEMNRAALLASLEDVDYIIMFDEPEPLEFIKAVQPDIHCNGQEYGQDCIERKLLDDIGARLYLINERKQDMDNKISTSLIIRKIAERYSK